MSDQENPTTPSSLSPLPVLSNQTPTNPCAPTFSCARSIFELQERTLSSVLTCLIFGVYVLLVAPLARPLYYLASPRLLFFVYVLPVVPFVLVFDGLVSSARTRTPDEVAALLRTCGAADAETGRWHLRSGRRRFLWPCGYMSWIICTKKR